MLRRRRDPLYLDAGRRHGDVLPSMLDHCLHVPALLTAKVNRHPMGTTYTGIRLTGEGQRRVLLMRDYLVRA